MESRKNQKSEQIYDISMPFILDKSNTDGEQFSQSSQDLEQSNLTKRKNNSNNLNESVLNNKYYKNHRLALQHSIKMSFMADSNYVYDPYKFPADLNEAKRHGLARRVCKPQIQDNVVISHSQLCKCCGLNTKNELIDLNCDIKEMAHIGTCFPQYFYYIKQCIIFMIVQFFIAALPAIISNFFVGESCDDGQIICEFTFLNIRTDTGKTYQKLQSGLNFLSIIVQMCLVRYFKMKQNVLKRELEDGSVRISDFAIIVKNVSQDSKISDIENFLESKVAGCTEEISKIFMLYDFNEYANIYKRIVKYIKKIIKYQELLREAQKQSEKNLQVDYKLSEKIASYKENKKKYEKKLHNAKIKKSKIENNLSKKGQIDNLQNQNDGQINYVKHQYFRDKYVEDSLPFSGILIIIFDRQSTQKQVTKFFKRSQKEKFGFKLMGINLNIMRSSLKRFEFSNKFIKIDQAPEPSDIIWNNLSSTTKTFKLTVISWLISYGCMIIALFSIIGIKRQVKDTKDNADAIFSFFLSLCIASIIALANTLIGIVIRTLSAKEQRNTQTKYFVRVARKLTRMFAINMTLTTFLANLMSYLMDKNTIIGRDNKIPVDYLNAINEYFFLFITSSYISSIFAIFDIVWGARLYRRYKAEQDVRKTQLLQQEANQLFEGHPVDMALRYANVVKIVQYTAVISPLIPIGVPMCVLGLTIIYWTDKYLLLRRFVCANFISHKMTQNMMELMSLSIVFFATGNLVTMFLPNQTSIKNWETPDFLTNIMFYLAVFGFLISLIFHFSPSKQKYFDKLYFKLKGISMNKALIKETYGEIQHILLENYDKFHPIFKDNHMDGPQKNNLEQSQNIIIASQTNLNKTSYYDSQENQDNFVSDIDIEHDTNDGGVVQKQYQSIIHSHNTNNTQKQHQQSVSEFEQVFEQVRKQINQHGFEQQ